MQYLDVVSKMTEWSLFVSKAKHSASWWSTSSHNHWCQRSWSGLVSWRPTTPSITNTPKRCLFHYMRLECKSRKSKNTWSNKQIWPWSTEWSRTRLIEYCQENTLIIANTFFQQHKRRCYMWTSPDDQYRNQIDYTLCSQRWRSSTQSAKTTSSWLWLRSWTPYCHIQT